MIIYYLSKQKNKPVSQVTPYSISFHSHSNLDFETISTHFSLIRGAWFRPGTPGRSNALTGRKTEKKHQFYRACMIRFEYSCPIECSTFDQRRLGGGGLYREKECHLGHSQKSHVRSGTKQKVRIPCMHYFRIE